MHQEKRNITQGHNVGRGRDVRTGTPPSGRWESLHRQSNIPKDGVTQGSALQGRKLFDVSLGQSSEFGFSQTFSEVQEGLWAGNTTSATTEE
ncbi:hypothetical protein EYF80_007860 [Liparis tanakae]|uniref:Uncharacterized protein n=1 Tax=Liparis tanakae TaxID=230148 RepID=A0A4Z2IXD2_9TELE|nr:hypothetical protein EYF80_007860 [Liparis tanakae]